MRLMQLSSGISNLLQCTKAMISHNRGCGNHKTTDRAEKVMRPARFFCWHGLPAMPGLIMTGSAPFPA
jgi:hypothetical protein